jgi:catechol 2,3-dioxygenase-like lactoylglutathione lyase family enzyme
MAEVTGLGGIFYKVADTERTKKWYAETLGLGGEWGIMLPYSRSPDGFGLLSAFKADSDYFGPSDKPFMINLRVDDLDGLVSALEAKGVEILGRQDDDFGRFAWILDCDGIKLELYQQAAAAGE